MSPRFFTATILLLLLINQSTATTQASISSLPDLSKPPKKNPQFDPFFTKKVIAAGITCSVMTMPASYLAIKKLHTNCKNKKKKNKKSLVIVNHEPIILKPAKSNKVTIAVPIRPSLPATTIGKIPTGKTAKSSENKATNATKKLTKQNIKIAKENKKLEEKAKDLIVKQEHIANKKEKKANPVIQTFKAKITIEDYRNFAIHNAHQVATLYQQSKQENTLSEFEEKKRICERHLASLYYIHRTHLNILKYQKKEHVQEQKSSTQTRNLLVHTIMDTTLSAFNRSLENLRTILPNQLADLKDHVTRPVYREYEINQLFNAFKISSPAPGPSSAEIKNMANTFGIPMAHEPELKDTPLLKDMLKSKITTEEKYSRIDQIRYDIHDSIYLDWLNKKIFPIINLLAAPLLKSNPIESTTTIVALKQLITFCGEFHYPKRALNPTYKNILSACRNLVRNPVDHEVNVDENEWIRTGKRCEQDIPNQIILNICRRIQEANPVMANLTDFNESFTYSLQTHKPIYTASNSSILFQPTVNKEKQPNNNQGLTPKEISIFPGL